MQTITLPHDHGHGGEDILARVPQIDAFSSVAASFRQLSDGNRLRIFWVLCHLEECVINLSAMMDMSSPAVSHHLKSLKNEGLIISRRDGKEVYYKAADTDKARALHDAMETMMDMTACPWNE